MKVIEGIENINETFENLCVALGTFDGVHKGHQKVINSAIKRAKEIGGTSMVFTFSPHPLKVLTSSTGPKLINSKEEKIYYLKKLGVDVVVFANFTIEFSNIHPEKFIKNIMKDILNVKELFVGFNYTFGKGGIGNTDYLTELSRDYNIYINVVPPVKSGDKIISSTLIRKLITKGDLKSASEYLGNNFVISGEVVHGKQFGRKIGFPTANLKIANKVYPPYGVYGVKVNIEEREQEYTGIMNIGMNPTLKPGEHSIEVHIFNFDEDIYGKNIIVNVLEFIRAEEKFSGIETLKEQIKKDIIKWEGILNAFN